MPYFDKYNILFIHIPKNAGMYIEKLLGIPEAIVSYRKPTDAPNVLYRLLAKTKQILTSFLKRDDPHYLSLKFKHLSQKFLYGSFGGYYYYHHASLWEIVNYRMLDKDLLDKCIILAVHRHPLDRLISVYKYWGFYKEMSFDDFCIRYVKNRDNVLDNFGLLMHLKTQFSFVANASPYTERVEWIAFENLERDLIQFINKHNLPLKLPKKRINTNSVKVNIVISRRIKTLIYDCYKEDFEIFGYKI